MEVLQKVYTKVISLMSPYPIWAVGGCTRDTLLGRIPKDYDFCTAASPDQIEQCVRNDGRRPYLTGKRFGTIGTKVEIDGVFQYVEITTFRRETYSHGSRKPEVQFVTDLKDEVSRRDFSINAITYQDGIYQDFFGGRLDLLQKKIKAVGNPKDRFTEDPLRMLRAARFAAQLDFEVDQHTEAMATRLAYKILTVSRERWVQEMDRLLVSDNPRAGLQFLVRTRLMNYMLAPLSLLPRYHNEIWQDTLELVSAAPKDVDMRWACLFQSLGKPFVYLPNKEGMGMYPRYELLSTEIARQLALYLRWSNGRTKSVIERIPNYRLVAAN